MRAIGEFSSEDYGESDGGILILSLESKDRAPGFSGLRVICARISWGLASDTVVCGANL